MDSPRPGTEEAGGKREMRGLGGQRCGRHHAQHAARSLGKHQLLSLLFQPPQCFPLADAQCSQMGRNLEDITWRFPTPEMESRAWKGLQS